MRPIFLIGLPASGKTTLGRAVAERTGLTYIDLDEAVETAAGMTIRELIAARGEEAFRVVERDTLRRLSAESEAIIGCGGGTPCYFDNLEVMNRSGLTVRLEACDATLARRIRLAPGQRPLVEADIEGYLRRLHAERDAVYARAAATFSGEKLETPEEVDESVDRFIKLFLT